MDVSGAIHLAVAESLRDGIWVFDPEGRTQYANPSLARMLGRTVEEMATTSVSDVLDEAGRAQFAAHLQKLRTVGETPHEVECCYLRQDGSPVHVLVSESTLYDDQGRATAYIHRLTSDEDREQLVRDVSRSRQLLDEAQEIARLASWELDLVTGELTWSRQLYAMFGVDPATFVPTEDEFYHRIVAEDRDRVAAIVREGRDQTGEFEFETQVHRVDGELGWVRGLGRVTYDAQRRPVSMQGTAQDITRLKEVELQLRDAVVINMLMQVIASAANSTSTLEEALRSIQGLLLGHEDWNRAVGWRVADAEPRLQWMRMQEDDQPPDDRDLTTAERALAAGDILFEEEGVRDEPQIGFPVMHRGSPVVVIVITAQGGPFERHDMLRTLVQQVAEQLSQVAERERSAAELAAARDAAMEASRLKSQFLATMSHEIRTPMNGVIGLNDLLLRTELSDHQRRLADGVHTAGRSLLGIINDILDFSKIEAGQLELESVAFEPRDVVRGVVAVLEPTAADREVSVWVRVSEDVPDIVVGDPGRLRQVLSNLVSNAIKFTRRGRVEIAVTRERGAGERVLLAFEVRDSGIGMAPDQLDRIFEPFLQADASMTRSHGGTGLGLAISRQLVHALGGEIRVVSEPGAGSTFRFTAAFDDAAGAASAHVAPSARASTARVGHVLVAEDNEINQLVTLGLLEALGYSADIARDGEEAVTMARSGRYDAVLMDLQMPVMDGYTATRLIRESGGALAQLPIVALTASATETERERCLAAGLDEFLTKPVEIERLAVVLGSRSRATTGGETATTPALDALPVLDASRLADLEEMGEGAAVLVARAIGNFLAGASEALETLRLAVEQDDADAVRARAHSLKGSALNLGAVRVGHLAHEMEELADAERSADAGAVLPRLAQALADARKALEDHRG